MEYYQRLTDLKEKNYSTPEPFRYLVQIRVGKRKTQKLSPETQVH